MYKPYRLLYAFIILLSVYFFACRDDFGNYSTNPQDRLSFSVDTLSFDTVLTTVYSPVLSFMIYNKNSKPLLISSVQLAGGANSDFKINVDGMAGNSFENIPILANDSLFVFVNVTPKENGQYTPTVFNDYVLFETNGVQQQVVLEACGQDVYAWRGVTLTADSVLDNKKPYLIYDSLVIAEGTTVEIGAGSVFYMHNNAQLIVNGTVKMEGTVENPVVFRGSRTDYMITIPYDLIPGQWGGIFFAPDSYDNDLENVRIRNGTYGINMDVCSDPSRNKLSMKNVALTNVTGNLLQAVNCNITAENCELSNANGALLNIVGGSSRFTQCTIVNYYPYNQQLGWINSDNATLILSDAVPNWDGGDDDYYPVISAEFDNSIIWGAKYASTSAIQINQFNTSAPISYLFRNCLIPNNRQDDPQVVNCLFQAVDSLLFQKTDPNDWVNNTWYPSFDFHLRKNSPARDIGDIEIATQVPYDLDGYDRLTDGLPDLGAYEFHEE